VDGSVVKFFVATFALSWLLWMPLMLWLRRSGRLGTRASESPLAGLPFMVGVSWFLGASAPSIVAIALAAHEGGWDTVRSLLSRLLEVDIGIEWNLVAWIGPMAVGLAAVAFFVQSGGKGVRLAVKRLPLAAVALLAAIPFGPLGEELGWRGYALPRLLDGRGGIAAALIVGVLWTVWHLPLVWAPMGTTISGSPVTVKAAGRYLVEVTATSVIMTWLFVNTGGSLWIAVGFHAAWNAGMHRFLFEPFEDATAKGSSEWVAALLILVAVVLVAWPGMGWHAG